MVIADEVLKLRSKFFRAMANTSRLGLLFTLCEGEKSVSTLADETGLTQSNVSGHLACLKDCGLVIGRREWRNVYYCLANERVEGLLRVTDDIVANTLKA